MTGTELDANRELTAEQYAAIVQYSDDAIISKDREGIITSWNPAAERIYGYSAEEAIGQPISILIPPHRRGEERRILERVLAGDRLDHYETERLTKDGQASDRLALGVADLRGRRVGGASVGDRARHHRQAPLAGSPRGFRR